jgi:hypothetical protein
MSLIVLAMKINKTVNYPEMGEFIEFKSIQPPHIRRLEDLITKFPN